MANGGKFESGFFSAGFSQAAGQYGLYNELGVKDDAQGWQVAHNAAVAAVVGGTISEATGGSFEQGALTAAMGRLFNDEAHSTEQKIARAFADSMNKFDALLKQYSPTPYYLKWDENGIYAAPIPGLQAGDVLGGSLILTPNRIKVIQNSDTNQIITVIRK